MYPLPKIEFWTMAGSRQSSAPHLAITLQLDTGAFPVPVFSQAVHFAATPTDRTVYVKWMGMYRIIWLALLSLVALTASAQIDSKYTALLARAQLGDPAAQIAIGESYLPGGVRDPDCRQAEEWFLKAGQQGGVSAQLRLASFYREGAHGCPRDMKQAATWYIKAAEQGDTSAQASVSVLYSFGQGVAQNYVEAYYWLDLAASAAGPEQEHFAANRQLAGAHITAEELQAVQQRAARWKAAHPAAKPGQ